MGAGNEVTSTIVSSLSALKAMSVESDDQLKAAARSLLPQYASGALGKNSEQGALVSSALLKRTNALASVNDCNVRVLDRWSSKKRSLGENAIRVSRPVSPSVASASEPVSEKGRALRSAQ